MKTIKQAPDMDKEKAMSNSNRFVALLLLLSAWGVLLAFRVSEINEKLDRIEQAVTTRPAEVPK